MTIKELLKLDIKQESIKKVDSFLASTIRNSEEYFIAISFKCRILHNLGKTNDALKLLYSFIPNFSDLDSCGIISICDSIIDICLDIDKMEEVNKFINIKNNHLPLSKSQSHIKDLIKLNLKNKNYFEAKTLLLKYIEDDLDKEDLCYALENLSNIYLSEHQYSKYLDLVPKLENLYQSLMMYDKLTKIESNKVKIAFDLGNFLQVITLGNQFLRDDINDNSSKVFVAALVIKSYVLSNDYKRAAIIESEYEEYLDDASKDDQALFCRYAYELYTKTNTVISANQYRTKLDSINANTEEKQEKKKKKNYIIPKIEEENEEQQEDLFTVRKVKKEVIVNKVEKIKEVVVSSNYERLSKVFSSISLLDVNVKYREVFRIACINICKEFNLDEAYCLYYRKEYSGLHYKKERAYNKKLSFEQIENTLNFQCLNHEQEMFLDLESDININIIDYKPYDKEYYGVAFPLVMENMTIGSIAYFNHEDFLSKEMVYESLKMITSMLNFKLNMSIKQESLEHDNNRLFFLSSSMSSGIKDQIDNYIHLSKQACEILGVISDLTIDDYYSKIDTQYVSEYKRIIEELYSIMSTDIEFEYKFKGKDGIITVRERFYPMYVDGVICIYSLIDDITESKKYEEKLKKLALTDPISHLDTHVKLNNDLKRFIGNKKLSLALFEINDFSLYKDIYGYNFSNEIIYAVGKELKELLETEFDCYSYHLEGNSFGILFNNINDKRVIDSKLRIIFKEISNNIYNINSRVKLEFSCGVYRLAKNSSVSEVSKIIHYANEALTLASSNEVIGNPIIHFDSENYKTRFNQNHLITHISEAIDHGRIGISYQQVVDVKLGEVHSYFARINLDNYDCEPSEMEYVIKRRNKTHELERYLITSVFKEQRLLYDKMHASISTIIPLSNISVDDKFYSFVMTNINFFKVKKESLIFLFNDCKNRGIQTLRKENILVASTNVMDVYSDNCDIFFYNKNTYGFETAVSIKKLCEEHNVTFILDGIDEKEDLEEAINNDFDIIYGKYYKKNIRMKTLLDKLSSNN